MGKDVDASIDGPASGAFSRVPWRWASTYADHMRDLPVREAGMVVLDRTHVEWKTLRASGRDSVIVRFHAPPLVTGHLVPAEGWVMVFAPLSWSGDHIFNGTEARIGDVFLITPRNGYVTTGRNRDILGVGLRANKLKMVMAALSGRREDDVTLSDCKLELGQELGRTFERKLLMLQKEAFAMPDAPGSFVIPPPDEAHLFEHVARHLILPSHDTGLIRDDRRSDFKVVCAARDAANACASLPSLAELCAAAKVGQTRLHESFISVHGISPARYLHQLRMTRAQEWLRDADHPPRSVKEAALSQGFAHGGRFAAEYFRIFGESPSCTLSRTLGNRSG